MKGLKIPGRLGLEGRRPLKVSRESGRTSDSGLKSLLLRGKAETSGVNRFLEGLQAGSFGESQMLPPPPPHTHPSGDS